MTHVTGKREGYLGHTQHTHSHYNFQCLDSFIRGRLVSLTGLLVSFICEGFHALHIILRARGRETGLLQSLDDTGILQCI